MDSGLLEGMEDVLVPAGGAVEMSHPEAGLSGADVVAGSGEGSASVMASLRQFVSARSRAWTVSALLRPR